MDNGANIGQGDYDSRTALHLAVCENQLSIIEYLLLTVKDIDVNPLDRLGNTPLDDAVREGRGVIRDMLKEYGGVSGEDPSMAEAQAVLARKKQKAKEDKTLRRQETLRLHETWVIVLAQLTDIYKGISEHLPALCKYLNLLRYLNLIF